MQYLDANVFIAPVLYSGPKADAATEILRQVQAGEEPAFTCALTIEEITHVVQNHAGREAGMRAGKAALALPNLSVVPVSADDVRAALGLMETIAKLAPRDAIHAAIALRHGAKELVSDDAGFGKVVGVKYRPLVR